MKKSLLILAGFCFLQGNSQNVGINTTTPEASLDVNGNLRIQDVPISSAAASQKFLVLDNNNKVEQVNGDYASAVNTTIAKAVKKNGLTLLDGTLFAGWQKINFAPNNILINPGGYLTSADDFYTVPSDGIYEINYEVRFGTGVQLSVLNFGGTPRIGILKHIATTYTVLDERTLSSAGVPLLLHVLISNSSINTIYDLKAGDKLSFEVNAGGLNLNVLGNGFASVTIKKISN